MTSKLKALVPIALFASLLLAGCGSKDASADTTPAPTNPSSTPAGPKSDVNKEGSKQSSPIKPEDLTK